jgi:ribose transport system permease protein
VTAGAAAPPTPQPSTTPPQVTADQDIATRITAAQKGQGVTHPDQTATQPGPPVPDPATGTATRHNPRTDLWLRVSPFAVAWVVTLIMIIVSVIAFPSSIKFSGLSTLTPLIGVLVIASLGQALVIGTGGIDLSSASVITLVGLAFVRYSNGEQTHVIKGLVAAIVVGLLCGLINGIAVEFLKLSPLVSTLATGQVMLGIATVWYEGGANSLSLPKNWLDFSSHTVHGVSYTLILGIALALLLSVLLSRTLGGRRLSAASTSIMTSRYQGIQVRRLRGGTYVLASLFYTIGGVLLAGTIGTPTLSLGSPYQLASIVAVVLGGASLAGGRVHPGAVLAGALFLAFINQDVQIAGWASGIQAVVQGVVLIAAMLVGSVSGFRNLHKKRSRSPLSRSTKGS